MLKPPVLEGATQFRVTIVFPGTALSVVGAPGTAMTVTLFDGLEATLAPFMFVALTVNVYVVPPVSPVIVTDVFDVVALKPPMFEVTV